MTINKLTSGLVAVCMATSLHAQVTQVTPAPTQLFKPADTAHFTGQANFAQLPTLPSPDGTGDVTVGMVNFTPNSFTDWHSHATGQYLIVTDGVGRFQEWGKPIQTIQKGDVIWIAPNVKHWHGVGEFTGMSHIAMSSKTNMAVQWLEKPQPNNPTVSRPTPPATITTLTAKQLSLIPIAIDVTLGNQKALQSHLEQGLALGLTVSELTEAISHQFAYIGALKTLNGVTTLKTLIDTRQKAGIHDPQGSPATPLGNVDYYTLGTQKLAKLSQAPTQRPIFAFAPAVDYSIKSYLYGYLFARDNLGDLERELVTVGSLLALGDSVNAQLNSHIALLKNLGVSPDAFSQITTTVEKVNKPYADNLKTVLTTHPSTKAH